MLRKLRNSHIALYLLFGFAVFICLMVIGWFITSKHIDEQMMVNASTHAAANKQHALSRLIEIARKRTRLSHEMLLSDDVFEKDEMSIQIANLASDFIVNRRQLMAQQLSEQEKAILASQLPFYPYIIESLEAVTELALEDTDEATEKARDIIFREIVPRQRKVIDGFTQMMRAIEDKVHTDSQNLVEKNQAYRQTSFLLLFSILLVAIVTIVMVTMNAMHVEDMLRLLSTTDELTGISNRRAFNEKLDKAWKGASRSGKPLAVLMIDIDYFKNYNDHYGHQKGDDCLFSVAKLIKSDVNRSGDIIARYGGEEFAIAIPNVDESGAKVVAERIIEQVRTERIPHEASEIAQYVSVSIGYASMIPSQENTSEALIKAADDALYESKRAGRNRATCTVCAKPNPVISLVQDS